MSTGEVIKRIRLAAHMTQSQFAEEIGCDQAFLSFCETGKRKPSIMTAKKILQVAKANKVKVKLEDLFPDE